MKKGAKGIELQADLSIACNGVEAFKIYNSTAADKIYLSIEDKSAIQYLPFKSLNPNLLLKLNRLIRRNSNQNLVIQHNGKTLAELGTAVPKINLLNLLGGLL